MDRSALLAHCGTQNTGPSIDQPRATVASISARVGQVAMIRLSAHAVVV